MGPPGELPDVLIIGAQKAGTTSLFYYLAQHPGVSASRTKEVHYFDNAYDKGETWYRRHFERRRGTEIFVEASPYYLYHPLAPARASALLPKAKLIVLLREPVSRAFSHYHHERARGFEPLSFEEAMNTEPQRLADSDARLARGEIGRSFEHQHFSYRSRGLYADQIERWLECFPASAFLFLKAEAMFIQNAADVAEAIRPHQFYVRSPPSHYEHSPEEMFDGEDVLRRVEELLGPSPAPVDEIIRLSGAPSGAVQMALLELDLAGRLDRHAGNKVSLRAA